MEDYITAAYNLCDGKRKLLPGSYKSQELLVVRLQTAAAIIPDFAKDLAELAEVYISNNILTVEEKRLLPLINYNITISFLLCL